MASQRLFIASLVGAAAERIDDWFRAWREVAPEPAVVDRLCRALRNNGMSPPVVYFSEWADHWLMGDSIPGPNPVEGRRCQAARFAPAEAVAWADAQVQDAPEKRWLSGRLREAAEYATAFGGHAVVVVGRDVLGPCLTDDEIRQSFPSAPVWLLEVDPDQPGSSAVNSAHPAPPERF